MKHYLHKGNSSLKMQFVMLLLIVFNLCPTVNFAQDKLVTPLPVDLNDTLTFSKEQKGVFDRLAQIIKFRENRDKKEKERIYKFILELINDQNLSIDSNTNELTKLLDSIIKIDSINKKTMTNKELIDSLKAKDIDSFEVAFKAPLDTVFKKRMEQHLLDHRAIDYTKSPSKNISNDNIKTDPIISTKTIVILLIVLVLISICVFLLYKKYG
ncbi:hypothetical protein [Winogradskyella sp. A2]|uniref:hypothetical protein n=1 Tax=Winogradskyella sp. A2 TaxID=3366944 RepID=UPI00398C6E85